VNGRSLDADDISAVIDQGDYLGLLRSIAAPRTERSPARETRQAAGGTAFPRTAPPKSRPDGKPVGAWPTGCGQPGDPVPHSSAA